MTLMFIKIACSVKTLSSNHDWVFIKRLTWKQVTHKIFATNYSWKCIKQNPRQKHIPEFFLQSIHWMLKKQQSQTQAWIMRFFIETAFIFPITHKPTNLNVIGQQVAPSWWFLIWKIVTPNIENFLIISGIGWRLLKKNIHENYLYLNFRVGRLIFDRIWLYSKSKIKDIQIAGVNVWPTVVVQWPC